MGKRIAFLTGTRADFGKIKSLIQALDSHENFEVYLFVTGMHLLHEYGYTLIEVERLGLKNIVSFSNHTSENTMELTLAKTIEGFSSFIRNCNPDMVVIHGDRVEALAGAIVGSLNNILTAHIEGGEISGTIDDLIRHSVSKLSHLHFVSNQKSKSRLIQMGEDEESIKIIGSPDIDLMFSEKLPDLKEVLKYYSIPFENYAVSLFHPVTTEIESTKLNARAYFKALIDSGCNYVVIYPNNDLGSKLIIEEIRQLEVKSNFKVLPSVRFEYFLTLLKKASFIIGNSSAGIREAPYYGVPTINVGSRQSGRSSFNSILNSDNNSNTILEKIKNVELASYPTMESEFGDGNSTQKFISALQKNETWRIQKQKQFVELN